VRILRTLRLAMRSSLYVAVPLIHASNFYCAPMTGINRQTWAEKMKFISGGVRGLPCLEIEPLRLRSGQALHPSDEGLTPGTPDLGHSYFWGGLRDGASGAKESHRCGTSGLIES
jgi:hypothetical protein